MIDYASSVDCMSAVKKIIQLSPKLMIFGIMIIPFISGILNVLTNKYLLEKNDEILACIILQFASGYFETIFRRKFHNIAIRSLSNQIIMRFNMANIKCGVVLPGKDIAKIDELMNDKYKLREFMFVIPTLWSTVVNIAISIYCFKIKSRYPIKLTLILICIVMCLVINVIRQKCRLSKPDGKVILNLRDANHVKNYLSLGYAVNTNYYKNKMEINDYAIMMINAILLCFDILITAYALISKNVKQVFIFRNVYQRIAQVSDCIDLLKHYEYVNDLITLLCMEKYTRDVPNATGDKLMDDFKSIQFVNATFGYYDDIIKAENYNVKINNLSYEFNRGMMYYIESPNGIGKSTLLRMFVMNLMHGDVYFKNKNDILINRKNVSFEYNSSIMYHVTQSSEYTSNITKKDIEHFIGKDQWLEKQLGLTNLFGKGTNEMSGGEKKRMFIYLSLVSPSQIILFDEVLSELSVNWIERVASTLIEWKGRNNKIILLVGHGMTNFMRKQNVINLTLIHNENTTSLEKA